MIDQLLFYFRVFCLPFLVVFGLAYVIYSRRPGISLIAGIHAFAQKRGFTVNGNLASEIMRLELLRIVSGLILCHRTFYVLLYLPREVTTGLEWAVALLVMACAIAFTLGLLTPLAGFILLIGMQPFDDFLGIGTLGTDVLNMILVALLFAPVGTALSLDSIARGNTGLLARVVAWFDDRFGVPTLERISVARILALTSYGMLCVYSALYHFKDPAWIEGYANVLLLSSSYLSRHYDVFRAAFLEHPFSLRLAELSIYGMMIWELLLLPLVFLHRITRAIVVVWGLLFFLVSTFLLHLGWLSYYEFVLWAILFWQGWWLNSRGESTIELLYDDRCNLCDRTVRTLVRLDLFQVISYRPLSKNRELMNRHGIDTGSALQDLYGIDASTGKLYKGYDLYTTLCARLLLLVPAWPIFMLGRLLRIGPAIYQWIARRRIQLFGVCELPAPLALRDFRSFDRRAVGETPNGRRMLAAFVFTYCVFLVVYVLRLPHVEDVWPLNKIDRVTTRVLKEAYETVGLAPINVFNKQDLRMSEVFFVMERLEKPGKWAMVPFTGLMGERLAWHESDRLYFGNSLRYRRGSADEMCFTPRQARYIRELVLTDREWNGVAASSYRIRYYRQPLPDTDQIRKYVFEYPKIEAMCEVTYDPVKQEVTNVTPLSPLYRVETEVK